MTPTRACCPICLDSLDTPVIQQDNKTKKVPVTLHQLKGIEHKVHRICVFERFMEQLEKEPQGKNPHDLKDLPFTCPICVQKVTLSEAENGSGVPLEMVIENMRLFNK